MKNLNLKFIALLPIVGVLLIAGLIHLWNSKENREVSSKGVPVPKPIASTEDQEKSLFGELTKGKGIKSNIKGSWPCFRGEDLNGINQDSIELLKEWPASGPPVLWELEMAKGHAGAVIHDGRVYVLDYDTEKLSDVLRCFSFETAEEIWRYTYPIKTKNNHGVTRSVPAVNDKYIVTIGPKAQVYCLEAKTGKFLWNKSLVLEYGAEIPKWYSGQCPLLEEEATIIAPCGPRGFVIKVDCKSGKTIWLSENKMEWDMTHTSVLPMQLPGIKTYLYSGSGGVAGVSAQTGEVLWSSNKWKIKIAACASPLVIDEERIFLSAGYGAGSMMLRVFNKAGEWATEVLYSKTEKEFGSVQHTPILYKNHIFGTSVKEGFLMCMDLNGKLIWTSGQKQFGIGPFMMIRDKMVLLDSKSCDLTLVDLNTTEYSELTSANLYDGHAAYGLMAYTSGLLIVRDLKKMVCLDISKEGYKNIR